ncbi:cytochrome P450 [Aspergillus ruber CBS 135680]|uniref:Cytochrome P450 n=1 Tax=Aspergillus ruber (strain CBS 135680) TaxID=1388766 RepID=A0A017S2R3_ASPRC|nr:cytochrome P450 [Aspergillus ruber CBS 135680]EYE91096.1 cytochrome P450 [Aspergillus ruber CBS 135680]
MCKLLFLKNRQSLPPGPMPMPIIGNIYEILKKSPMECFQNWHNEYGPIITLRYAQRLVISIGSYEIARDLLDKRGAIYSSRPRLIMASERMTNGMNLAIIPYNKRWRIHNRITTSLLDMGAIKRYRPLEDRESKQVLFELLSSDDFSKSLARFSASLVLTLGYGMHLERKDCDEPRELERIDARPFEALGSMYCLLVELFPVLDHTPRFMAPWKWLAADVERQTTALHMKHLQTAKSTLKWNWVLEAMGSDSGKQLPDKELAYMIGTLEQAGFEAILTVTRLLIKAIVLHPKCMESAQNELDRVVGSDRLPSAEDRPRLPYVNAMIEEAMRWQPPAPFALPHANTEDDEYMGYHIPKGTMIIPNIWVMAFNPQEFPNPYQYKPERWLEGPSVQHNSFGFGRRLCPGRHLGYSSVFLVVSRLLWAYNISHAYRDGKKIEVDPWDLKFTFAAVSGPFEASFQVRSPKHQEIIEKEWAAAKDIDSILDEIKPETCT